MTVTSERTAGAGPDALIDSLADAGYLADRGLATVAHLALRLERPLLVEGEAGVGKTSLAAALAAVVGGPLIRLQCYDGIDASQALYEWDHARQLLALRAGEATGSLSGHDAAAVESDLYAERFLVRRPLLQAISFPAGSPRPVLLIDEVDRADDEFEALLLEVLSEYSITIPELGPQSAVVRPIVILTSNRTRDLHDALKRRCLYHWVEHPSIDREIAIVRLRAPQVSEVVARQVATLVSHFRELGLYKPPGVAEAVDWAMALSVLGAELTVETALDTLGTVVKYREDRSRIEAADLGAMIDDAQLS